MISKGDRLRWGGQTVEVVTVLAEDGERFDVILKGPGGLDQVTLSLAEVDAARQPANDGGGSSVGAIAGLWANWMEWATPRIRSAATATKPLKPFAHQDEAVFVHMLPQPRLRFLGLPRVRLTSLTPGRAGREGCPDAQEVSAGVQA